MTRTLIAFVFLYTSSVFAIGWAAAWQPDSNRPSGGQKQAPESESIRDPIVAVVGNHKITASRVKRHLEQTVGKQQLAKPILARAQAVALEHLVNRYIVFDLLNNSEFAAGKNEVRLQIEQLVQRLRQFEQSIEEYLAATERTRDQLEMEIAWKICWGKFLKAKLSNEYLASHYEKFKRQFDGTEIRVAHLLIKFSADSENAAAIHKVKTKLKSVREQVLKGSLSWSEAVADHSEAASKDEGGEIGWIRLSEPMPPRFSEAAFELNRGEISPPVRTQFGFHLIKCLDIRAGVRGWRDAESEVRQHATTFLFDDISQKHKKNVSIKYADDWPHFDQSGKLVGNK